MILGHNYSLSLFSWQEGVAVKQLAKRGSCHTDKNKNRLCGQANYIRQSTANGKSKGKAALLLLYSELYNKIARLEWRISPEPLQLSVLPQWANLT